MWMRYGKTTHSVEAALIAANNGNNVLFFVHNATMQGLVSALIGDIAAEKGWKVATTRGNAVRVNKRGVISVRHESAKTIAMAGVGGVVIADHACDWATHHEVLLRNRIREARGD